ncbi:MAG: flagellar basal body-associated protein FliL [Rhizobiales bacterium PAR1]|nr:MAG: flagellar basal body-associated protein FliL [Rhizobiales bacterium PAR1]
MAASAVQADDLPEEGKEAGKKSGGSKKKMIIFAVLGLLVLGGAGGGYYFWAKGKAAEAEKSSMKKKMVFFDLPEITTNLALLPGQERQSYLRLRVALEVEDQKMIAEITPLMPRVMDNFQIFLRELRPTDLEGSAGLYRLKEELVRRINAAIYPARIEAILFKDVLVQ